MQSLIVSTDHAVRITNLRAVPAVEPWDVPAQPATKLDVWAVSPDEGYCVPVAPPSLEPLHDLTTLADETARLNSDPRLRGGRVMVCDSRGDVLHMVEIPA